MAKNYALLPDAVKMYTQTETLKEVKDMSKNLVSGEFEREYRSGVLEKGGRRRQTWLGVVAAALVALAAWLLVLTVVREVQLANLRHELDQLTANMIAVTANVKSLNQKISNNRLFNEFKNLEDTIYPDEEDDTIPVDGKSEKDDESHMSLAKLEGLTTLEDEEDIGDDGTYDDDDDEDEDDDVESGDFYPEYYKGNDKVGGMDKLKLKPEEFLGSVVTLGKERQKASIIREIKRLLNENPENPDITLPPPVASSQLLEQPALSHTGRDKRSISAEAIAEEIDPIAAPSAVAKSEFTRKSKKYDLSKDTSAVKVHGVSRIARNSEDENGRPFIAAHFHGDTSQLNPATHKHYKGNGMVMMPHEAAHNVWTAAAWTRASPHRVPTVNRHGRIEVYHSGIYFVYAQIYYLDRHDIISWVLHRTNADLDGRDTLLQCAQSTHSTNEDEKPNSCFSAAALFLKAGDRLAVRNTGGDRHSLMQPEKSFIGLVKLADAEEPNE